MRRKRRKTGLEARLVRIVPVLLVASAACAAPAPAAARSSVGKAALALPVVRLRESIPTVLSSGERLSVAGTVRHGPAGARVALERRRAGGWHVVARARVRRGAFELSWRPPPEETLTLRITLRSRGRVISYSTPVSVRTGRAPRYCPTPQRPADVPAGDGWIVGGLYDSGGPAPGIFECRAGPYTVAAIDEAGEESASEHVTGRSYVLVLAPGSYELEALETSCFSEESVTVVAGRATKANTVCDIP